jgi:hypothetical protein
MAYDVDEPKDPSVFTEKDIEMGGWIGTRTSDGSIAVQKPNRIRTNVDWHDHRHDGHGNDKMTMAQYKATMAALWRDGQSYAKIAEAVSDRYGLKGADRIHPNLVHYHIKQMLSYWRQLVAQRIDERQALALARLDQLEQLALEGYFRSVEGKETKSTSKQIERARSRERSAQMRDNISKDKRYEKDRRYLKRDKLEAHNVEDDADLMLTMAEKTQKIIKREMAGPGDVKFLNLIFGIQKERNKLLGLYSKEAAHDGAKEAAMLTDEQRTQRLTTIFQAAQKRRTDTMSALAEPSPLGGFPVEVKEEPVPEIEDEWQDEVTPEDEEGWD